MTGASATPRLDWNNVAGAATYEVQVATNSAFTSIFRSALNLTTSEWIVSPPLNGATTYYWRARAVNSGGASAWSPVWSFTTAGIATAEPTIQTGSAYRVSGRFTDTQFADGRFERFQLACSGVPRLCGVDLDWDTQQGQFSRLMVPNISVLSIDIVMKLRLVDANSGQAGGLMANYTRGGGLEQIGDLIDLPSGSWVTVTVTDTNPLDHLDIGGHYHLELTVGADQAGQIDIDQINLVFHLR
jgi:hypothetical protein